MNSVVVTDSKYRFVPPHEGNLWPRFLGHLVPLYLSRRYKVVQVEIRGEERLETLLAAKHGVLITPNHCRMSDALVLQCLANQLRRPSFIMASSHLFRGSRFLSWLLPRLGAFSINREGIDRQAVQKATEILTAGQRPLVVFPEGALSQSNDHLHALQEGVSFIARTAAAKLEKSRSGDDASQQRRIFAVPVAIRYVFLGDIAQTAGEILTSIEQRLSWRPLSTLDLVERIYKVGNALLTLKELEFLGTATSGELDERLNRLINHLLVPIETEWLGGAKTGSVIARVKEIRRAVIPEMIEGQLPEEEIRRRMRQLDNSSFAQSLSLYPAHYVASRPTADRILETVERFNEHLSGDETAHGPMKAIVQVGEPIEVSPKRDRSAPVDVLLRTIEDSLRDLLARSADECVLCQSSSQSVPEGIL